MSQSIFNTVYDKDYLGFTKEGHIKNIVTFLDFQINDVSKATGQAKSSIRYDDRIPHELQERLEEIGNIINLTATYFDGDLKKTSIWYKTKNPLLGDISPRDMIRYGRYAKLRKFIVNAISGNSP